MPAPRSWLRVGNTVVDFQTVVKIVFNAADAQLFAVSGEALLMAAWTKDRVEIGKLKEHASLATGWMKVRTDLEAPETFEQRLRLSAVDKAVFTETKSGPMAELFITGVYSGQVVGEDGIEAVKRGLGI